MAHYIGKYSSENEAKTALSKGDLLTPYVVAIDLGYTQELHYSSDENPITPWATPVIDIDTASTISNEGAMLTFNITAESYYTIYLDGNYVIRSNSSSGYVRIDSNYSLSELHHFLLFKFDDGDSEVGEEYDEIAFNLVQDPAVAHIEAVYFTQEENQELQIFYTSYLPSVCTIDGVSKRYTDYPNGKYTFQTAGWHYIYFYSFSAEIPGYFGSTDVMSISDLTGSITATSYYFAESASTLTTVSLPALELLQQRSFNWCTNLQYLNAPNIKTINAQAVTNSKLTDIVATGVTSLGSKALQFNNDLDPVGMPLSGVTSIGNNALRASSIKEAHFGPALTTYDYNVFNECYSLSALTFDGVTGLTSMPSVGDKTYALTDVVFPDCVVEYGQTGNYGLFKNSSGLTSVTFGANSATMHNLFLGDMPSLTSITCKATIAPTVDSGAFAAVTGNTGTLYVPAGSDYSTWAAELGSNWTVSDTL